MSRATSALKQRTRNVSSIQLGGQCEQIVQSIFWPSVLVVSLVAPSGRNLGAVVHKIQNGNSDIDDGRVALVEVLLRDPVGARCGGHCSWWLIASRVLSNRHICTARSFGRKTYWVVGRRSAHVVVRVREQFESRRQNRFGSLVVYRIGKPCTRWHNIERQPSACDATRLLICQATVISGCCNV